MTQEKAEALIRKLEISAKNNPFLYKLKVFFISFSGNLYLALILLLAIVGLGLTGILLLKMKLIAMKLMIPLLVFIWIIVKSLWVKMDPPEGIEVKKSEAADLFAVVNQIRKQVKAPRLHRLLVTDEFNAGIVQKPTLGLFGWHQSYLLIGLPLLKLLTIEQFQSVLAHEFGHLAGGHGKLASWIYRQRLRWSRIIEAMHHGEKDVSWIFAPLKRFHEYFVVYSFPLARQEEFDADSIAARTTSPEISAQALSALQVGKVFLHTKFWPEIFAPADHEPTPSILPYSTLDGNLNSQMTHEEIEEALSNALEDKTGYSDTHPSFSDRLAAIGQSPEVIFPEGNSATSLLSKNKLSEIIETLDSQWKEAATPGWEERYMAIARRKQQLQELNEKRERGEELTLQEKYDRVLREEEFGDKEAAFVELKNLASAYPGEGILQLATGVRQLYKDEKEGMEFLNRARDSKQDLEADVHEVIRDYFWRNGREEEAHSEEAKRVEFLKQYKKKDKERNSVLMKDKFIPHGLEPEKIKLLLENIKDIRYIKKVYLVIKEVQFDKDQPQYVLGYTVSGLFKSARVNRKKKVMEKLQRNEGLPYGSLIINLQDENRNFYGKMKRIENSKVI